MLPYLMCHFCSPLRLLLRALRAFIFFSLFGFFFWSTVFCLLALLGPSYVETAKNRLLHCPNNCRWLWRRRRQRQRRRRRLLLLPLPIMRHVPHVLQLVGVDTPSHGALKSVTVLDRKLLTKVQIKLKTWRKFKDLSSFGGSSLYK